MCLQKSNLDVLLNTKRLLNLPLMLFSFPSLGLSEMRAPFLFGVCLLQEKGVVGVYRSLAGVQGVVLADNENDKNDKNDKKGFYTKLGLECEKCDFM